MNITEVLAQNHRASKTPSRNLIPGLSNSQGLYYPAPTLPLQPPLPVLSHKRSQPLYASARPHYLPFPREDVFHLCLCPSYSFCLECPPLFPPPVTLVNFHSPFSTQFKSLLYEDFPSTHTPDSYLVCNISLTFISFYSPDKDAKMSRVTAELLRIIRWQNIIYYIVPDCSLVYH